jgi:hypothetical protein
MKLPFLIAILYCAHLSPGTANAAEPDRKTVMGYVGGAEMNDYSEPEKIACTVDQGRTCQRVSDTCASACRNLLAKAYQDCVDVCSCNYYHCKTACGDNATMPPSCRQ